MRKLKPDPQSIIACETPDNATFAYLAMFRYAFGRMTYMPSLVIRVIKRNAATLTDKLLFLLDRELTGAEKYYERVYSKNGAIGVSNYGHDCDRHDWREFHLWVIKQIELRKEKESTNGIEQ